MGLNTRRYHGLVVAATKPPVGRGVMLSKVEDAFFIEGQAFDLSANQYPGVIHPQGFKYLKQFRLDPFPVFTYEIEGIEIEKSVFMVHGENSSVVQYELKKNNHPERPKKLWLELRPLIAFRDYHSTTHENGAINPAVEKRSGLARVDPYQGLPSLFLAHNAAELRKTGDWDRNFEDEREDERGLECLGPSRHPLAVRDTHHIETTTLLTFAKHVHQGMLPIRLPHPGETTESNTFVAILLFFEAARSFLAYTDYFYIVPAAP